MNDKHDYHNQNAVEKRYNTQSNKNENQQEDGFTISTAEFLDATDGFIGNLFDWNGTTTRKSYCYIMMPLLLIEAICLTQITFVGSFFIELAFNIFTFCLIARRSTSADFDSDNPRYNRFLAIITFVPFAGFIYDILLMLVRNNITTNNK